MSDKLKPSGYLARVQREIKTLLSNTSEGITAWPRNEEEIVPIAEENHRQQLSGVWIDAVLTPPAHTPYASGTFRLECCLTRAYPFCPPHCKFITPIYHPNIDAHGRICVDILKEGTEPGKWRVTFNLLTVLSVIRQLLAEPNPDDPLEADIASEYKRNKLLFERKARENTLLHASIPEKPKEAPSPIQYPVPATHVPGPTGVHENLVPLVQAPAAASSVTTGTELPKRKRSPSPAQQPTSVSHVGQGGKEGWLAQKKRPALRGTSGFGIRPATGFAKFGNAVPKKES